MPIIREFRCRDCGTTFESLSQSPECPTCTGESERAFLTPPAIVSQNTGRADKIQQELASDFGLSDMTNKYGRPVKEAPSDSPAQFSGDIASVVSRIPTNAQNGFAPFMGKLAHPVTLPKRKAM